MPPGKKIGRVFVISAPSGAGKTTVCEALLAGIKNLKRSVSVTTRAPRPNEKNARDYFYTDAKKFRQSIKKGEFLEWEENFGCLYGTPGKFVSETVKSGRDILLSIDVKGAMQVKKALPASVLIFLKPPSMKELARRLRGRNTDRPKEINARLRRAKNEMKYADKYDYVIVNDRLEHAVKAIISIIKQKRRA